MVNTEDTQHSTLAWMKKCYVKLLLNIIRSDNDLNSAISTNTPLQQLN